jgi:hypothetical protein
MRFNTVFNLGLIAAVGSLLACAPAHAAGALPAAGGNGNAGPSPLALLPEEARLPAVVAAGVLACGLGLYLLWRMLASFLKGLLYAALLAAVAGGAAALCVPGVADRFKEAAERMGPVIKQAADALGLNKARPVATPEAGV